MRYNGVYTDDEPTSDELGEMTLEMFKLWCQGRNWRYALNAARELKRQAWIRETARQRRVITVGEHGTRLWAEVGDIINGQLVR